MKKVLFVFMMALMSVCVLAQEKLPNEEELLLGFWKTSGDLMEVGGGPNGPVAVGGLSLNANRDSYISYTNPYNGYYTQFEFSSFFVSDNNKLHLISKMPTQMNSLTFVIKWLEYDRTNNQCILHLRPLGSSKDEEYLFYREGGINGVSSVRNEANTSDRKYSISGTVIENPDGIYIQKGKKYIAK